MLVLPVPSIEATLLLVGVDGSAPAPASAPRASQQTTAFGSLGDMAMTLMNPLWQFGRTDDGPMGMYFLCRGTTTRRGLESKNGGPGSTLIE